VARHPEVNRLGQPYSPPVKSRLEANVGIGGRVSPQPSPELIKPNRFFAFPEPGLTLAHICSHYVLTMKTR
jgi:hypothetical protein